jgi:hypothetical protein
MRLAAWYDFAGQGTLVARNGNGPTLGFTRSGQARREDDSGWIRTVESGEPRFLGAPFTHNLQLSSNDFSVGADWTKLNSSVVQNATDAFGNENTAWTVTGDGAGAGVEFSGLRGDGFITGIPIGYTGLCSIDVKARNATWVTMYGLGNSGSNDVWFNIVEGYVGTQEANVIDAGVIDLNNGWYRVWFAQEVTGGDSRMYISAADDDGVGGWTNTSVQDLFEVSRGMAENVSGKWIAENIVSNTNLADPNWNHLSVTLTSNQDDPFDGKEAVQFVADSGGSFRAIREPNDTYSEVSIESMYVKAGTTNFITLYMGSGADVGFDLSDGSYLIDQPVEGYGILSAGVERLRDGWYRCYAKIQVPQPTHTALYPYWVIANALGSVSCDAGDSVIAYGPAIETAKPNQSEPVPLVHTSGGPATKYRPSNYIETDTAAITFSTGPCEGLMIEETRVNLCLASDDFSDAIWSEGANAAAVVGNEALAPDGSYTFDLLVDNGLGGSGVVAITQNGKSVATSSPYTLSCFARANGLHEIRFDFANNGALVLTQYFNLDTGTIGASGADVDDAGIIDCGNGVYRCWMAFTADAVDTTGNIEIDIADGGSISVPLDGGSSVYLWRCVLEAGAFPTSAIRTAGGTTTRNAETEISGAIQSDVRDAHTLYAEYQLLYSTNCLSGYVLHVNDGTLSNSVGILSRNTLGYQCLSATTAGGGAPTAIDSVGSLTHTAALKGAFGFAENNSEWYVDGVRVLGGDQTVDILGNDISQIRVGSRVGGGNQISNGLIKEVRWYDMRMTEDQLAKMGQTPSIMPGYDKTKMRKQKAIDAAIWNKAMNARTREARSESEEDYVPYNNIG